MLARKGQGKKGKITTGKDRTGKNRKGKEINETNGWERKGK